MPTIVIYTYLRQGQRILLSCINEIHHIFAIIAFELRFVPPGNPFNVFCSYFFKIICDI